jgi:spermidine synthase
VAPEVKAAEDGGQLSLGVSYKVLHALAIFLSAFLLFQVEPLVAKVILPWFGGVAAVWTVCLLFFQVALLLGYLYAHLLTRSFGRRAQGWVHAGLLAASLLTLPILPREAWKPVGPEQPALHILMVLGLTVGLPFFLLSSTTPLLQAWFAREKEDAGVYRLYALSNGASLLALLSYPTLFEPMLTTVRQAWMWSWAYVGAAGVCGVIAVRGREEAQRDREERRVPRLEWKTQTRWMALSACSSALLLAITNHISQNIAAVPLLWVIPLSLYLLSFILCFEGRRWYPRTAYLRLLGVAIGGMTYALSPELAALPFWLAIGMFCGGLFVCCMFCHGELARLKPEPAQLTTFYFLCSLGSLAGALFVALVAPRIFSGYYELHVALAVCAVLVIVVHRGDAASPFHAAGARPVWVIVNGLAAVVVVSLFVTARTQAAGTKRMVRNFYGVLKVTEEVVPSVAVLKDGARAPADEDMRVRRLTNGTISHGLEFLSAARRDQPTTYYGESSGIGVALGAKAEHGALRVGVIGLGVGTIAAYGRAGDKYTFYEINPLDVRIAQEDFNFLRDAKAEVTIELGDARLTLEQETPQGFDVLTVDAFSSDAIPVHLLTLEAFELYFRHLKAEGLLALHISNQHLNLEPVVAAAAERLGKEAVMVRNENHYAQGVFKATWVLVGSGDAFRSAPAIEKAGQRAAVSSAMKLWTDGHSSVFSMLK